MIMNIDGEIIDPDREVNDVLARLVTFDPDADVRRMAEECPGMDAGPLLLPLLRELEHRRQWMRRYAQHPPTCAAARGERCDCGLA